MTERYDAVVIGGGHNGLIAANYLARAGLKTIVVERRDIVGGASITEEFHPGYRNSVAAYAFGMFRDDIVEDLGLAQRGLVALPYAGEVKLLYDGRQIQLTGEEGQDRPTIESFAPGDYDNMKRLYAQLDRVGPLFRKIWLNEPPDLAGGLQALLAGFGLAAEFGRLQEADRHFMLQIFTMSAWDLFSCWFESSTMRDIFTGHCVSGNYTSLYAPGSALPFLSALIRRTDGKKRKWGMAKGGMGGLISALTCAAREHNVEIRTGSPVSRVLVRDGRAVGVKLATGREIAARVVLSNADPISTFLTLVGRENLDRNFADSIARLRVGQGAFRMNLALAGQPEFASIPAERADRARQSAITVLPDAQSLERSFQASRQGEISVEPFLHIQISSALDPDLAPPGCHVMAVMAKYFPYRLSGGRDWNALKDEVADGIVRIIGRHMPNLRELIVARQIMSAVDLERIFALPEGDVFHIRNDLDQIFSLRPHPKAARYRTPVRALYLCGAGVHPGGGITGGPGFNAAKRVLKDFKHLR